MLTADNYKYYFVMREERINFIKDQPLTAHNEIYSIYMNSNGDGSVTNCCPVYYYWDESVRGCVPITIADCMESNDNTDCTKCI